MIHIDAIAYQSKWSEKYIIERVSLLLSWLLVMLVLNNTAIFIFSGILSILLTLNLSRLKLTQYVKIVSIPLGFIIFTCVVLLPVTSSTSFYNALVSVKIGSLWIGITDGSFHTALATFIRASASVCLLMCLSLTIPLQGIIIWMNWIHVPHAFAELFILTYRFIFVLIGIASELIVSQELRFGFIGIANSTKSITHIASALFIKALSRLEDLEASMELRFFNDERER